MAILGAYESLEDGACEGPDETPLVVLHHLVVVVLYEFDLEVGKVEATVVVGCKLVCHVQDHFVRTVLRHKRMSHGSSNLKHLLVG